MTTVSLESIPAETLAKQLVRDGRLTLFQAQLAIIGKASSLVIGSYVVLEKLGQGGMGQVFKARHKTMKREVALKVISPSVLKDATSLGRFQREVEAAAQLNHPNIVTAHDAGEFKGTHYLVMEYIRGKDLSSLVRSSGPMMAAKAVGMILQTAKGLDYAHKHGIIHRDIKPANLLLDESGAVKILDMGLARFDAAAQDHASVAGLTGTGMLMGTIDYMSPEQAMDSKTADARSDIYSLGCTLYFLLAGKAVYEEDTVVKRLMAHQSAPIPALPILDIVLQQILERMIAKKADDRYASCTQLADDLQRWLDQFTASSIKATQEMPLGVPDDISLAELRPLASGPASAASAMNKPISVLPALHEGRLLIVNPATGDIISELAFPEHLLEAAWTSDSHHLAVVRDRNSIVRIIDAQTMNVIQEFVNSGGDTDAAWSADGHWLAIADHFTTSIYDAKAILGGQVPTRLHQMTKGAKGIEFSPDSTHLAIAHDGHTSIFQTSDWKEVWTVPIGGLDVHWSPDGQCVVCGNRRYSASDGKLLNTVPAFSRTILGPSKDGGKLATVSENSLRIWNGDDGVLLNDFPQLKVGSSQLQWNSDGTRLLRLENIDAANVTAAELIDPATGQTLQTLNGHSGRVWKIACSPVGTLAATAGEDGQCLLWETSTGTLVRTLKHSEPQWWIQWSADGKLVASGSRTAITIWDSATGEQKRAFKTLFVPLWPPGNSVAPMPPSVS